MLSHGLYSLTLAAEAGGSGGGGALSVQAAISIAVAMFVVMLLLGAVIFLVRRKPGMNKGDEISAAGAVAALPALPELQAVRAPAKPAGTLDRHRLLTAVENRGRHEACRIALELESKVSAADSDAAANEQDEKTPARVWLIAGPGPLGASAMAAARHLDSLGLQATVQTIQYVDKLGDDALIQRRILQAMRARLIESPHPQSLAGIQLLAIAADAEKLAETRRKGLEEIIRRAKEQGIPFEEWEEFSPHFAPPPPAEPGQPRGPGDVVIPVPDVAVTREDARLLDTLGIDAFKIPGGALMENAGYGAARTAFLMAREIEHAPAPDGTKRTAGWTASIVVICGKGNNGGDGLVVARHLLQWGHPQDRLKVFLLGLKNRVTDDTRRNLVLLEKAGLKVIPLFDAAQWPSVDEALKEADLLIDGVLGTGMLGAVRGWPAEMIPKMNAQRARGAKILALDCPSGLDCNTGLPLGMCIEADVTVTFAALKTGFALGEAPRLCGKIEVVDIGLPREIYRRRAALAASGSKPAFDSDIDLENSDNAQDSGAAETEQDTEMSTE